MGSVRDLAAVAGECDQLGAVLWEWQAADGVMGKSRFDDDKAVVIEPPDPEKGRPAPLSRQAYDKASGEVCYHAHIRRIGEEKLDEFGLKSNPARRRMVERTIAWLQKCQAILVRYDKKSENYEGLVQLACALRWRRRLDWVDEPGEFSDSY